MRIVQIEPLDKRRRKVLLDEGFAFVLYGGEIRRYQIEEGGELSRDTYDEIVNSILCRRARERMLYLLKASDKTEAEVRKKLTQAWYPEPAVEAAVAFAKQHRYIDDAGYAERYIRCRGTRKGRRQIAYELQQKGINREVIEQCLEVIPIDEERVVRSYLKKKGLEGRDLSPEERSKAGMALGRKGISWEIIRKVLDDDGQWDT